MGILSVSFLRRLLAGVLLVSTTITVNNFVNAQEGCHYNGEWTESGSSHRGPTETCTCVDGQWKVCYENTGGGGSGHKWEDYDYDWQKASGSVDLHEVDDWWDDDGGWVDDDWSEDYNWSEDHHDKVCHYNGKTYHEGDKYHGHKETCTCRNGQWKDCKDNKEECKRNGDYCDYGKTCNFGDERCFCDWNGEIRDCKKRQCEKNGYKCDYGKTCNFGDEECYCDWDGKVKNCKKKKCKHNGYECDYGKTCNFGDEECYCDWNGKVKDCKRKKCKHNGYECDYGKTCNFGDEECYCDWNGKVKDCKRKKCKHNGHECDYGKTCNFGDEECYCDWDGKVKNCKSNTCKRNGYECDYGRTCDFGDERCFCDWNGNVIDCEYKKGKCYRDGNEWEPDRWINFGDEECYCDKYGDWECMDIHHNNNNDRCYWDGRAYETEKWHNRGHHYCYCNKHGKWECDHDPQPGRCETIGDIICDNDKHEKYGLFCDAIETLESRCNYKHHGRYHDRDDKLTVFVPTNDGIKEYLGIFNDRDVEREFDRWKCYDLEDFVLVNVVYDKVYDERDLKDRCSDLVRMANNQNTRTVCEDSQRRIYQKGEGNNDENKPRIRKFDIDACNGIIHELDKVIRPKGW